MLRFVDQIHQAFAETVRSGQLRGFEDFPGLLRDLDLPPEERDRLWATALGGYVSGPRQPWAALVLKTTSPDLGIFIATLPPLPGSIRHEDVAHQFIAELLAAAAGGPTDPPRWSPNRILTRASTATYRCLARELRSLAKASDVVAESHAPFALPELVTDLEQRAGRTVGIRILHREAVLRESLGQVAMDLSLSKNAARHRRRRAVATLRRELAASASRGPRLAGSMLRHNRPRCLRVKPTNWSLNTA